MSDVIYFDNSATTAVSATVAQVMSDVIRDCYGNPSSVHKLGLEAEHILSDARTTVLSALGIRNTFGHRLIFTGSGTEADNIALLGTVRAKKHRVAPRIIITDSEHPAISEPAKALEEDGAEVVRLSTRGGVINMYELRAALTPNTVLVSVMLVNNETGAIYDLPSISETVRSVCPTALVHCDAVQGFMKLPISVQKLGVDMLTVSAHKINGPKGVGALYVAPGLIEKHRVSPIVFGGGQEGGMRSGTENLPGIAGFACAVKEKKDTIPQRSEKLSALREYILSRLPQEVCVNTPTGKHLPGIISITLPNIKSEVMLRHLSQYDICVSSGSACSSKRRSVNPVLLAFGLSNAQADSTLRISLSSDNTENEADRFIEVLCDGLSRLVRIK